MVADGDGPRRARKAARAGLPMTARASGGDEAVILDAAPLHAATPKPKPKPEPAALAAAARCGARTRSGAPCRSPAVGGAGRCRMHGGKGSGAPRGNRNAWKHGWHSARIREISRYVRATTPGATRRTIDRLRRAAELQAEKISKSAQQPHATALSANRSQRHTHPRPVESRATAPCGQKLGRPR